MNVSSPLERLNLQHLRALDVLLTERSVTRAAQRLGMTQSAVSHALRGLREILDDALLVRGAGGMLPTPRAEALRTPLARALRDLESALSASQSFDPEAPRTFRVAMSDAFTLLLLPELMAIVRAEAPGLDLDVRPSPRGRPAQALERGEIDLALVVGTLPEGSSLRTRLLARGELACVVRSDHPRVGATLDLDTFCALPHALISPRGEGPGVVDSVLDALGRSRRIHLRIRYFLAAPLLIARSDLILTGPRRLMQRLANMASLKVLEPPLALPGFTTHLLWHARMHDDPGHRWFRDAVLRSVV